MNLVHVAPGRSHAADVKTSSHARFIPAYCGLARGGQSAAKRQEANGTRLQVTERPLRLPPETVAHPAPLCVNLEIVVVYTLHLLHAAASQQTVHYHASYTQHFAILMPIHRFTKKQKVMMNIAVRSIEV